MKTSLQQLSILTAAIFFGAVGCQQTSQQRRPSAAAPAPAPGPAGVPAASRITCTDPTRGLVGLAKQMPRDATLGQTFEYVLNYTSQECVGDVVIADHIPSGASYVRSEPPAEVNGDALVWRLRELDSGAAGSIHVWLKADKEGTIGSCAIVTANPRVCGSTVVGQPALAIEKTGPEMATIGSPIAYNITVSNKGSAVAKDVVVTDPVPQGLSGDPVSVNVGDLAPSQSKSVPVRFTATQRGRFCNVATAESSNAGKVNAEACTVVVQAGVKITKEGPREQFLGRGANYNIVVANTGDTTLTGVVLTDTAPAGTSIMQSGDANVSGNTATFNLGDIAKGDSKTVTVTLTANTAGQYCNSATVATAQGLKDTAEACTTWRGVSGLLLEKGDNPDPIQVNEQTTYFVRVTNQGTAPDADVKVVVNFPAQLTPISADNGGMVQGQTVTFPPVATLDPKQSFEYHIIAKGAQPGDARVTFIRTSRDIPAPTSAEESTRVY